VRACRNRPHRLGRVNSWRGERSDSGRNARRGPAFEASSRYAIERIGRDVPIWKREVWSDGYVWAGEPGRHPSTGQVQYYVRQPFGERIGECILKPHGQRSVFFNMDFWHPGWDGCGADSCYRAPRGSHGEPYQPSLRPPDSETISSVPSGELMEETAFKGKFAVST